MHFKVDRTERLAANFTSPHQFIIIITLFNVFFSVVTSGSDNFATSFMKKLLIFISPKEIYQNDTFLVGDRCERSWIEKIAAEASDAGSNIITPAMWKKYESEMARNNDATGIIFGIVCGSIILILTLIVLGPWIKGCLCPTFSLRKFYRKAREVKIDKVLNNSKERNLTGRRFSQKSSFSIRAELQRSEKWRKVLSGRFGRAHSEDQTDSTMRSPLKL
jgi:hypothetical protein